jgi:hypothetical protein
MQRHKRKCIITFFEGAATSASSHIAAWMAVASMTFLWQFLGHVAVDTGFYLAAVFAGH